DRRADRVGLPPDVAVLADLRGQLGGQRVDHGHTDAVQATGHRVGIAVELAARVQRGHDDLDRGPVLDRVLVDRDTTTVVPRRDPAVGQQGHLDPVAIAGEGFVYGIVDDLIDEVMQTALTGRADVHTGALADRL